MTARQDSYLRVEHWIMERVLNKIPRPVFGHSGGWRELHNENLDTVILLWTLYCTKHRSWFHESLMMIEIFTKLPLKI